MAKHMKCRFSFLQEAQHRIRTRRQAFGFGADSESSFVGDQDIDSILRTRIEPAGIPRFTESNPYVPILMDESVGHGLEDTVRIDGLVMSRFFFI